MIRRVGLVSFRLMNKPFSWILGCAVVAAMALSLPAAEPLQIAVIPKGTTHEFWKSIHAGTVKAQQELEKEGVAVKILWKGPLREDDRDQQIQVVENFTSRRVNGILLAPLDSQALVRPVAAATSAKIPVVVFDSGLKSDKQVSFVATDNFKGGKLAAAEMGRLLGGKGRVILLRYAVGSASTEEREAGFLAGLKDFPDIRLVSADQYAGPTRETAYANSQNLLNRFGREVDGIFTVNENSTIGMTKALRDIGRAGGKVKMIGFDAGSQSVKDMKAGDVQGLVVQNPVRMGYLGVRTLVAHLQGKPVDKVIDTGVKLVTGENMEQPEFHELLNPPIQQYLGK